MGQLQPPAESLHSRRRAFWIRQVLQRHWISSALCLIGLLLFALTDWLEERRHAHVAVGRYLQRMGVRSLVVEVRGELKAHGCRPGGRPWRASAVWPCW